MEVVVNLSGGIAPQKYMKMGRGSPVSCTDKSKFEYPKQFKVVIHRKKE